MKNTTEYEVSAMYAYDQRLSLILAAKYPQLFEEQACYNNVYHLVSEYLEELRPRDQLRILFCYRQGPDGRYYRHVFAVFDGKLIEPLSYLDMSEKNRSSIIPIKDMSVKEYLDYLFEEAETQLRDSLYQDDLDVVRKHGIFKALNPYDLARLYREIDEAWTPEEQGDVV